MLKQAHQGIEKETVGEEKIVENIGFEPTTPTLPA